MFQKAITLLRDLPQKMQRNTSGKKYLPEVDGLRFIAIIPVLFQHLSERVIRNFSGEFSVPIEQDQFAFAISRGTIGVFIFFAISGFILTLPFAKHYLDNKPKIAYKNYLRKRITRIEPPFLIWMSVFAVILLLKGAYEFQELLPRFISSIFYSHSLIYGEYSVINPVAWSLEIEIQFYLIAPFLIALFYKIKDKLTRRLIFVSAITGFLTLQHYAGWMIFPYKASILGQLQHFLIGMLLADIYLLDWRKSVSKNWLWDIISLVSFVVLMYTWTSEYFKSLVFAVALFTLLTGAFKGKLFSIFLKNRLISIIGGMCYTIYLVHLPLMELQMKITGQLAITNIFWINLFCQAIIALPLILLISAGLFLATEKPFMDSNWTQKLKSQFKKTAKVMKSSFTKLQSISLLKAKYFLSICILFISVSSLFSQTSVSYSPTTDNAFIAPKLPPLDSLIGLALNFSPDLQVQDKWIQIKAKEKDIKKKDILDKIAVGGSALIGTGTIYDAWTDGENPADFTSYRRNVGYNTGITVRITAGDIFKGKEKRQLATLELEKAILERRPMEQQIREEVIRRYDDLTYCLKMIDIKAENLEAMRLSLEVAEPYFNAGNLVASEYTTILSKKIKAEEELETTKARTVHCWRSLKEICGIR